MGGDHHHGPKVIIPDWRIYKVEDAPELVKVQKMLAAKGLKDPWLRNEVWRYDRKEWGTWKSRIHYQFGRGLKWGFIAFGITTALETIRDTLSPELPHGHGDHGHH